MKNRLIHYIIIAIIWAGAGSTYGQYSPACASHSEPQGTFKTIPLQRLHQNTQSTLEDASRNFPAVPHHEAVSEKEASDDDESETPTLQGERASREGYLEISARPIPLPFHLISVLPLFILLHSWRHYLVA